ncbi:hypothetical protein C3729_10450 [Cloacibacterium normanense]|uniref:Uncharacterized protein n=1 Tax=Cloacibacterium normanense TaxID=237258 RepID=A0A2S7I3G2_9FLAO|nr:hypothetical protein [Cloacibacterium normanense]PPZ91084.1 hypothetical protein C3729_10450 [Cloacibacterium normanense]
MLHSFYEKYQISNTFALFGTFVTFIENHPTLLFIVVQIIALVFDLIRQKILKQKTKSTINQKGKTFEVNQKNE